MAAARCCRVGWARGADVCPSGGGCVVSRAPAGPFLEPVKWKEWGLLDYPKIIKNPMDLSTVKVGASCRARVPVAGGRACPRAAAVHLLRTRPPRVVLQTKLEGGGYSHPKEFRHDVNLVWNNCMTYNADGSEYYTIASNLKKVFEEKYAKAVKDDGEATGQERRAMAAVAVAVVVVVEHGGKSQRSHIAGTCLPHPACCFLLALVLALQTTARAAAARAVPPP